MSQLLRYSIARFLHPTRSDFINMGLGIEARRKRCGKYWQSHLECSKLFQRESFLRQPALEEVTVLGAVELNDLDSEGVRARFSRINLCDANPLVNRKWIKFARSLSSRQAVTFCNEDLTYSLDSWSEALRGFFVEYPEENVEALACFLGSLRCSPKAARPWMDADVIVSLNLLGQIPLYWRDRVQQAALEYWDYDTDENGLYPLYLQEALHLSLSKLQSQHIELLASSGASCIVIISDVNYMYYTKVHSHWQTEPALLISKNLSLKNRHLADQSSWYWHIAPQDIEQPGYGIIHEVGAWRFENRGGN
ncbi:MAG: hypothetical protein J5J00_07775 [Deltaproteobacteria bacterium]|nr:hypothetical protein [Deltaproteobacteria bacterium]